MPGLKKSVLAVLKPFLSRRKFALIVAVGMAASLSEGIGLLLLVPLLDMANGETGGQLPDWMNGFGVPLRLEAMLAAFVVLITLRAALVQWRMILEARARLQVTDGLRSALFRAILKADWRYLSALRQGELLSQTTSLADRAGFGLQFALSLIAAVFSLLTLFAAALIISALPALAVAAGGVFVLALYAGVRRRAARDGHHLGQRFTGFYDFFVERFDALRIIKSLDKADHEANRAAAIADDLARAQLRFQTDMALGQIVLQAGAALVLAGAVWFALARWEVPITALLPLVALFARSVPLLAAVQVNWQQYAHHVPAIREIDARLAEARSWSEPGLSQGAAAPVLRHDIRLQDVSVHFDGRAEASLDRITLSIPAGSVCFVTGPSGAGKSTLADLLAGLTRADSGQLLVDGHELQGAVWAAWRQRVSYVQQEPILFDATIRENLTWALPDASEAQLIDCLKRGSARFVLDLPQGLDTRVGSSGRQLSGGERQRIVLSRALLRNPDLLILDEATSALDEDNETHISHAVAALRGAMTIVIIGHGGKLAEQADRIVRLEKGRINAK